MIISGSKIRLFFLRLFTRFYPELVIGSIITVLAVGYFWFLQTGFQQILTQEHYNLESIKADADYLDGHLRDLQLLNDKYSQFNRSAMDKFTAILPVEPDLPGLFVQMEAIAKQSGFLLHNVQFAENKTDNPATVASEQVVGAVPKISAIASVGIVASVSGGDYFQLNGFLDSLEANMRLLDVESVNFASANGGPYQITLRAYYMPR
ncbi:MAG: hypothetical protein PHI63_00700 [Patescibacteria group bacterium]|nr:hypothetical protein [Patescibacteria group bacterium]